MHLNSCKTILFCLIMVFFCLKNTITAQPYFDLSKSSNKDTILYFLSNCEVPYKKPPIDFNGLQKHIDNGGNLDAVSLQQFVKEENACILDNKKVKFLYRKNKKWNIYNFNFEKMNTFAYDSIKSVPYSADTEEIPRYCWGKSKNNLSYDCQCSRICRDIVLDKNKKKDLYLCLIDTLLVLDADSIKPISNANNFYGYFKNNKMGFINTQNAYISPLEYDSFRLLGGKNPLVLYKKPNDIHILLERADTSKIYVEGYTQVLDFVPAMYKYIKFICEKKQQTFPPPVIMSGQSYGFFCGIKVENKKNVIFDIVYNSYYLKVFYFSNEFKIWSVGINEFLDIWSENYALFFVKKIFKIKEIKDLKSLVPSFQP